MADRTASHTEGPVLPAGLDTITSLGGGHGLFQTLLANRVLKAPFINAVVTVADDGGSSGRLRRELGQLPPGDLRMALAALTADDARCRMWEKVIQHRFGGTGALAGHSVGNLLIAGLTDILGDHVAALDVVAGLLGSTSRVLPVCDQPLDIEADVAGLDRDPRVLHPVRGQVAVATTPGTVRRVRVIPQAPKACPQALKAISDADLVTLGPGSWFSSVIPHLLVPDIVWALNNTKAIKVLILNLAPEPGETAGFSMERHIHMVAQHAPELRLDGIIVDERTAMTQLEREHLDRAAHSLGARVFFFDVQADTPQPVHDPEKLACALASVFVALTDKS